ncbi:hypothetical protein LCGC14_0380820 [marine sediment metagenome]|uniref:Uncharacterized protein n=1 Tax=marine sediment metagenome TaxID=412755 RepID=A0A0F9VPS0_9ZZZZ
MDSFDLAEASKKYNWEDVKNIKVSFIVKNCRNETDANIQVYCVFKEFFVNEFMMKLDESHWGKMSLPGENKSKLEKLQEDFQKFWLEHIEFEVVKK